VIQRNGAILVCALNYPAHERPRGFNLTIFCGDAPLDLFQSYG
jgi:hypothetical protein